MRVRTICVACRSICACGFSGTGPNVSSCHIDVSGYSGSASFHDYTTTSDVLVGQWGSTIRSKDHANHGCVNTSRSEGASWSSSMRQRTLSRPQTKRATDCTGESSRSRSARSTNFCVNCRVSHFGSTSRTRRNPSESFKRSSSSPASAATGQDADESRCTSRGATVCDHS